MPFRSIRRCIAGMDRRDAVLCEVYRPCAPFGDWSWRVLWSVHSRTSACEPRCLFWNYWNWFFRNHRALGIDLASIHIYSDTWLPHSVEDNHLQFWIPGCNNILMMQPTCLGCQFWLGSMGYHLRTGGSAMNSENLSWRQSTQFSRALGRVEWLGEAALFGSSSLKMQSTWMMVMQLFSQNHHPH